MCPIGFRNGVLAERPKLITTHLLQKKICIEKLLFSLCCFRSFAIKCAILQMLFAVCKKSARCERCVGEEKLYEPEIGRFFTNKKKRKEKKIELFSVVMCSALEMLFIAFYFIFFSVVMRRRKKENDHAQWRSFIFFFCNT